MGCCLIAALIFGTPRLALAIIWLGTPWFKAFESGLVALLGFLFLPWTTMAWMYAFYHGGLAGGNIILFIIALLFDLGSYGHPAVTTRHGRQRQQV